VADTILDVSERFYSIQGESTRAGLPCLFIRLTGCNLRCSYCDSSYTWEEPGTATTVEALLAWADGYPEVMVEITGGEPLLQEGVYALMEKFLEKGRKVLLETNGSVSINRVPAGVAVILDIKCPGSGMDSSTDWKNIEILSARAEGGSRDEIKFVLTSRQDFFWAGDIVKRNRLDMIAPVLFSPVASTFPPRELAEEILRHQLPVRLQMQLHRLLWPERGRGA